MLICWREQICFASQLSFETGLSHLMRTFVSIAIDF
jgi:hypothetical protein